MQPIKSFVSAALFAFAVAAPLASRAANSINLIYSGPAVGNSITTLPTYIPAFNDWCAPPVGVPAEQVCVPTVQQVFLDMSTGLPRATMYIWARLPFNPGSIIPSSFCFREFFIVSLADGDLYAYSGPNGTCGGQMDPVLKPPIAGSGAGIVIAGGGDGVIAGGTNRYASWTNGTFTDRVFVGFNAPGTGANGTGIIYYDSLMFSFIK